jgi:small subunit ribosomal protein S6
MILNEYENITIVRPDLPDDDLKRINDRLDAIIASYDGAMIARDDWGVRRLAYPIKRQARGRYTYLYFVSTAPCILEVQRVIRIESEVIRFLTVRLGQNVDIETCKANAANRRRFPVDDLEPLMDEDGEEFIIKEKDEEDGGMGGSFDRDRYDDNE